MLFDLNGKIVIFVFMIGGKIKFFFFVEKEWKWVIELFKEVCIFVKIKNIKIVIEFINRYEIYFINWIDEVILFV